MKHKYWWQKDVDSTRVTSYVVDAVRWLDDNQGYQQEKILDAMRMYGNCDATGYHGDDYARVSSSGDLKWNLIRSVVDTANALLSTNKTKPMFLTTEGDYLAQEKAKKANKFGSGVLYQSGFYSDIGPMVLKDAALFGRGFAKAFERDGKVCFERIFPGEIIVDNLEARNNEPRQLFQHKEVAREILLERFPEHEAKIEKAGLLRGRSSSRRPNSVCDVVSIIEAWHLPSSKNAADGRNIVCLSDGPALVDKPWTRMSFPFATMSWTKPLLGFWPASLIDQLEGVQIEINYLLQKIQRLMTLATTQLWVHEGSQINTGRITNDDLAINEYTSVPPTVLNMQSASPEYFQHLDRLWQRGFELAGISEMAAQSKKPGGLDSGKAIREHKDTQTQRFMDIEQAYEQLHLDAVKQGIYVAKEMYKRDGEFSVLARGSRSTETVKWSEVDLEEDAYVLQAYPTNMLPATPAAKIETAGEFADRFPEMRPYLLGLFDFPDVKSAVSLVNADSEYVDLLIHQMIHKGDYHPPDPMSNLQLAVTKMTQHYVRGKVDGVPEDRLQLLQDYVTTATAMMQQQQAQMTPAQAAPTQQPQMEPQTPAPEMAQQII